MATYTPEAKNEYLTSMLLVMVRWQMCLNWCYNYLDLKRNFRIRNKVWPDSKNFRYTRHVEMLWIYFSLNSHSLPFKVLLISSVQFLSRVWFFVTPWTAARQASLSITNSWSLLILMLIESVMPSNHLILWVPFSSRLQSFPASVQFSSVQLLCPVQLFVTPWVAACQASLSISNTQSSSKLMCIEWIMPSSHLILCRPLLLLPPIPPSIRVFSIESTVRMRWPQVLEFQPQHQSFQWTPRTGLL